MKKKRDNVPFSPFSPDLVISYITSITPTAYIIPAYGKVPCLTIATPSSFCVPGNKMPFTTTTTTTTGNYFMFICLLFLIKMYTTRSRIAHVYTYKLLS